MQVFIVPDMTCDGCVRAIASAVKAVDAKAELRVDLATKHVRVDGTAPAAALLAAMEDAGFTPQLEAA